MFYSLHFHMNSVLIYNVYIHGCIFCCLQQELNNFIEIELTEIKEHKFMLLQYLLLTRTFKEIIAKCNKSDVVEHWTHTIY